MGGKENISSGFGPNKDLDERLNAETILGSEQC